MSVLPQVRRVRVFERFVQMLRQRKRGWRKGNRAFHSSVPLSSVKDPYSVLGVGKDASPADIKKVYFQLARKYHPDQNPDQGAREKFVEIQQAYDILKDDKKRAAYDQYGAASQQPGFDPESFSQGSFSGGSFSGGFPGFQGFSAAFGKGARGSPSDLFEQLFGMGTPMGGSARTSKGDDIEAQVTLGFLEACRGATRTINITPLAYCTTCAGSGIKPGARRSTCGTCGGSGTRTFVIESGFQMASTCGTCDGSGYIVQRKDQCTTCSGSGMMKSKKSVNVTIPPGAEDGMFLRVHAAGHGAPTPKGKPGDLLVRVNVTPSKIFRRQGANLYHSARIPLHVALLGGKARIPTLDGDVEVRVPSGTQHGEEMVFKGKGVPSMRGSVMGDMFVSFEIQIPRSLSKRQREILQEYANDVEGRGADTPSSHSSASTHHHSKGQSDNNGTTSSPSPQPSTFQGGWASRAWHKMRELTGV